MPHPPSTWTCSPTQKLYEPQVLGTFLEAFIKAMTNLDSILKNRDITLLTKVCIVKAMIFAVVLYGCENWTIKKAECQRMDAFELWCGEDTQESLGLQRDQANQF